MVILQEYNKKPVIMISEKLFVEILEDVFKFKRMNETKKIK